MHNGPHVALLSADPATHDAVAAALARLGCNWTLEVISSPQPLFHRSLPASSGPPRHAARTPAGLQLLLMDLTIEATDGITLADRLRLLQPELRIVLLARSGDTMAPVRALMLGASGCLLPPFSAEQVAESLGRAADARLGFCSQAEALLRGSLLRASSACGALGLSPREHETMPHLVAGVGDKELAKALGVSTGTAHWYRMRLFKRFGVHNAEQLVARLLLTRPA